MLKKVTVLLSLIFVAGAVVLLSPTLRPQTSSVFSADNGLAYLNKQVSYGPRVPGTTSHKECLGYLTKELSRHTDKVVLQHFNANISGRQLPMTNIVAFSNCEAPKQLLLAAHWDSRPTADQEVISENRNKPIPGANDGASGVAVLLELARVFASKKPDIGIVFVLFDGEDYGPGAKNMYLGSKYFASNMRSILGHNGQTLKPGAGIVLDMVGDKDLNIYVEANSLDTAPELVGDVWSTANKLGYSRHFIDSVKYKISDDHLPLIRAGLPCIDIIDFDYRYWHTLSDTPDKCSGESLKTVGDVVAAYVYSLKSR